MKCRFGDESMYDFHEADAKEACFLCRKACKKTFTVREIKSQKMVHLCGGCMVKNISGYMLDNTRPWEEPE
jgi:hypothetical protein